ncbi:MAG TPA: DNA replication and repair protein RecF [Acidimicrobiaceae bacterium]|nr:DNA replication and repair protein RecF [Acidimicrobiaceae bacterium]HCB37912.1 DNA replication and repair protein RecF [Acidimicrobiaceae bacterium]
MRINRLALRNFRNHAATDIAPDPALTLVTGPNGHGKTNLLEAIDLLCGRRSFRGAQPADLIGPAGRPAAATVRAEVERHGRVAEVALRVAAGEPTRATVNGNAVKRLADLADTVATVVFTPADLALVQGSPSNRRDLLDELGAADREYRRRRVDLDRILRQRNNLLKHSRRRLDDEAACTLDVWDAQFADCAEYLGAARAELVGRLRPAVGEYYDRVAGAAAGTTLEYRAPWRGSAAAALAAARADDLRRGVSTVGPHRDDVALGVDAMPAATHCSQGEQRSLALALRLAQHRLLSETFDDPPVVLLDDVFSELDHDRARNLVGCLPDCQTVVTSATGTLPAAAAERMRAGTRIELRHGAVQS